ncbi:hypothetical protein RHGRI_017487 [Rhododendron griersonianum]|nr:hypothetical protein RHGRI_017487 [Rhododendron griersonianum]
MKGLIGGIGGFWKWPPFDSQSRRRNRRKDRRSKPSDWSDSTGGVADYQFPLKQALTAGALALAGDTVAQLRQRWVKAQALEDQSPPFHDESSQDVTGTLLSDHDFLRALRMASYGFLLYGPGSYTWYQYLDRCMPNQTVENLLLKVLLNQIVLGPAVIAVVFAWNNMWQGKLLELPNKYKNDALPTLFTGFRFWIPVSALNFGTTFQLSVHQQTMSGRTNNFPLVQTQGSRRPGEGYDAGASNANGWNSVHAAMFPRPHFRAGQNSRGGFQVPWLPTDDQRVMAGAWGLSR